MPEKLLNSSSQNFKFPSLWLSVLFIESFTSVDSTDLNISVVDSCFNREKRSGINTISLEKRTVHSLHNQMEKYLPDHPRPEAAIAYLIHNIYCIGCRVDLGTALATMRAAKDNL